MHPRILLTLALPFLFGFGGAAPTQQLNPKVLYEHDIRVEVNGKPYTGVGVLPRAKKYEIKANPWGKADLVTINNCHGDKSLHGQGSEFSYLYQPSHPLELSGSCLLEFGAYDKKGQHGWAMFDFEDPEATLPASVSCNFDPVYTSKGVTICQSRVGTIQDIVFDVPVDQESDPGCMLSYGVPTEPALPADRHFRFFMPSGKCVHTFMEKVAPYREHRLTTLGYESILVRED